MTDGVRVIDSGTELGRVTIATRDFEAGDIVLAEPPAIVFSTDNGYFGVWNAYLEAPEETKRAILEMHHTPIPAGEEGIVFILMDPRQRMIADELRRFYASSSVEYQMELHEALARNLVAVVDANAHSYTTRDAGSVLSKSAGDDPNTLPDTLALYALGSKLEHSCAPNVSYRNTRDGMLEYIAETPIKEGDRVTFSYAPNIFEKSREYRRLSLETDRQFVCNCKRCAGLDECVPLTCAECNEGVIFQTASDGHWSCVMCSWEGPNTHDILQQVEKQAEFASKAVSIRESYQTEGVDQTAFDKTLRLQIQLAQRIHALHWLHPMLLDIVSTLASSFARGAMQSGQTPEQVTHLLRLSALCQLHRMIWIQRNVAIVHGLLPLKDAVVGIHGKAAYRVSLSPTVNEIESAIETLVGGGNDDGERPLHDNTVLAYHVFHAGLDLILAGHVQLATQLYTRYQGVLSRWKNLSSESQQRITLLVDSNGADNRFENHLI